MATNELIQKLIPTIFEDESLLIVAKPAGIDVGEADGHATNGLIQILSSVRGKAETLEPVNRLSRYESGILILGKEPAVAQHLRKALRSGRVAQEYHAVVIGKPRQPRLTIKSPGAKKDSKPIQKNRSRTQRPANVGASTVIHLIRQYTRRAIVRCTTSAGTTHALRAQLRAVRLRLVGDRLHDQSISVQKAEQTCLHLSKITLRIPASETTRTLRSRTPETFDVTASGGHDVRRALHAALTRRLACGVNSSCDAFRLLTGDHEEVKGLVAEKYGRVGILQVHSTRAALTDALSDIAHWYRGTLGLRAVYVKHFVKNRLMVDEGVSQSLHTSKPIVGRPVSEEIPIIENGLTFQIRPYAGFSVGLFLDHRENRGRVRAMSGGKDVLNLFAYTCGFSVAAAAGGAKSTVSVDISPGYLEWGKENFKANGLDPAGHQFVRSPATDYLNRAERQGKQFDLIILDPPTFSHGRKRKQSFSVSRDLTGLINASVRLLRPGGEIMLATSYRQFSVRDLREHVRAGAGRRKFKVTATPALPIDYAIDRDHAKTLFIRFQ